MHRQALLTLQVPAASFLDLAGETDLEGDKEPRQRARYEVQIPRFSMQRLMRWMPLTLKHAIMRPFCGPVLVLRATDLLVFVTA